MLAKTRRKFSRVDPNDLVFDGWSRQPSSGGSLAQSRRGIWRRECFRTGDDWAQVDYDGSNIPVPRSKYVENGYKPDFDKLPLEAEFASDIAFLTTDKQCQVLRQTIEVSKSP
jgi:hypothetical protein